MQASPHQNSQQYRESAQHVKLHLFNAAFLFAVRQQINSYHDGSNLRIASPQATIKAGASACNWRGFILLDKVISANGFATMVLTCVRVATASSRPESTA